MPRVNPKSPLLAVTTANTVYDATLVRAYASANTLVTITDADSAVVGTFVMPGGTVDFIEKSPTDTITANVALSCTRVGYTA